MSKVNVPMEGIHKKEKIEIWCSWNTNRNNSYSSGATVYTPTKRKSIKGGFVTGVSNSSSFKKYLEIAVYYTDGTSQTIFSRAFTSNVTKYPLNIDFTAKKEVLRYVTTFSKDNHTLNANPDTSFAVFGLFVE